MEKSETVTILEIAYHHLDVRSTEIVNESIKLRGKDISALDLEFKQNQLARASITQILKRKKP